MKKIIYIRTSTEDQTPELQLRDIEKISGPDLEIFKEQESAWSSETKRPVFEKIKSQIIHGKISDIYVFDLDRIYRNRKNLQDFFTLCKTFKVKIHSYNQQFLESINAIPAPFDEILYPFLVSVIGWMGEDESTKKSKRVKLAIVKKNGIAYSHEGRKWGRKQKIFIDKGELVKLREVEKMSYRDIAKKLKVSKTYVVNSLK